MTRAVEQNSLITSDSKIGLTFANLMTLAAILSAGVIGWKNIPTATEVQSITAATVQRSMQEQKIEMVQLSSRLDAIAKDATSTNSQLAKLNDRLDNMLIVMASMAAEDMSTNKHAKDAAAQIRRNLKTGVDPLEGLPWNEH